MKKYQVREYQKGQWDIICHHSKYVFGSPDTFDSRLDAVMMTESLEKTNPNPDDEFFADWLMIDKD